jgi:Fe-S cluster biogenesis protein NfuA/nitrite reductase/ring-hydroxylating ferredoxin subunit
MPADRELRAAADRIEALLQELGALGDPHARARAEELVRLLMNLYGAGLNRILEIVHQEIGEIGGAGGAGESGAAAAADRLFDRLADDGLVSGLLVLHGLHPLDLETRILRALDRVRPYLGSHGGDVTLLAVDEGVVRLRLEGSCHGCPSSTVTMKLAIERAIEEAAPEISGIAVEGAAAPEDPPGHAPDAAAGGLLQIGQNGNGRHPGQGGNTAGPGWISVGPPPQPGPGGLAALELPGVRVVVCKVDEVWYAYRDSCPSCGSLLAGGALEGEALACPACARRYDVRRAGGCVDMEGPRLEPLPLLVERNALLIAVPEAAKGAGSRA